MKYYLYGKIDESGKVIDTFSRPQAYFEDGTLVDDEHLAKYENIYPIKTTLDENIDSKKFIAYENDKSKFILDESNNIIINYYTYKERSIDDIKSMICSNINAIRDSKIYSNVEYSFPNEIVGIIQIRDFNDLFNIRSLNLLASLKPDFIFNFIDESNIIHKLNSKQILDMIEFIELRIQSLINVCYFHKEEILKINNIDDLLNYNFNINW